MPQQTTARRDEPSLAEVFAALAPFRAVLARVSPHRRDRLAPVILRAMGVLLSDAQVVVVPVGPDSIPALGDEMIALMDELLGDAGDLDERLAVLDAVSGVVGKLDARAYSALQKTGL